MEREAIADAFSVSVTELISGMPVLNENVSANMLRSKFYICPVCGNVIHCNRDGLFYIDVVKGIDDREKSYNDTKERRELEKIAAKLFG